MNRPDVVVAGGGIIGCSIAWRLARKGLTVEIRDAGPIGGEASYAGAGMLAPGGEVETESVWSARAVTSLRMYPDFVAELVAESGETIDYRSCAAVEPAYSSTELEEKRKRGAAQQRLGIPSVALDRASVLDLVPHLEPRGLLGGVLYPEDAIVDPRGVVRALRKACAMRGASIRENDPVRDALRIDAGAVVVAAGAWAGPLVANAPASFPVKGHLIGYDVPSGSIGPIVRRGHTYVLQRNSGRVVAGTTTERAGFDRRVDPALVAALHRRAHELLPRLLVASPDDSWVGFRPGIDSPEPAVGRFGETRVWLAYGHYRNGILLAPVTAELIAAEIAR